MTSVELFEESLEWLKNNYSRFTFYLERDIVFTLQTYLNDLIKKNSLPIKVYNDYPILPGTNNRRHLCADLAIKTDDAVDVAVEFKYEPDHERKNTDILLSRLPVVVWSGECSISKDIERACKYVHENKARHAYSILIDEGGHFRQREPFPGSAWQDWKDVAALIARF